MYNVASRIEFGARESKMSVTNVTNETSFSDYRQKLHAIFRNNRIGMRFNANDWWKLQGGSSTKRAAFRLGTSIRYQTEFLSFWELFDNSEEFGECLDVLVRKARSIRASRPFTTVVTCTATGKYILEQLHPKLETPLERVRLEYLPIHPFLTPDRKAVLNFEGQKVLIFTDVVASGSLAKHMATIVSQLGGKVVGALGIAVVSEELLDSQKPNLDYIEIPIETSNEALDYSEALRPPSKTIRLDYLADFRIRALKPGEYDEDCVVKIDPYSVYPEEATFRLNGVPTAFSLQEMYRHWEESNAIAFDFFESDGSRFLTGLRIERLFEKFGDQIWQKLSSWFSDKSEDPLGQQLTVVCTFKPSDIRFKEFIIERLGSASRFAKTCYLHRRHATETTDYFFVPESTREELEDKSVVLLLSAASSSQTLREIVSILASCKVRMVRVIALVNRMGPGTCDFIDRIRTIFCGSRGEDVSGIHAPFSFQAVYSVNDLQSMDIGRIQDTLTTLFEQYEGKTLVPSFRNATQQIRKYFESQQVSTWEFANSIPTAILPYSLEVPYGHERTVVRVETREGQFSLLCHALVTNGDFDAVIEQFAFVDDRRAILKLFALVLLDLSHLRLTGQYTKLRKLILDRVESLRTKRISLEVGNPADESLIDEIQRSLETETTLLCCVALMSYLEQDTDELQEISQFALTAGKTLNQWLESPRNFLQQLAEDRVVWVISMLLSHAPRNYPCSKELVKSVFRYLHSLQTNPRVDDYLPVNSDGEKIEPVSKSQRREIGGLIRRAKDNLDMLLTECGVHKHGTYHSCLRYLHSHLISTRAHHSPLATSLTAIGSSLDQAIQEAIAEENAAGLVVSPEQPLRCATADLQARLEEAIHNIGIIEQIAEESSFLFRFTPMAPNVAERYTNALLPNGFHSQIRRTRDLLLRIRRFNAVSKSEVSVISDARGKILEHLFDNDSLLRRTVKRYIVPLQSTLIESLNYAQDLFQAKKKNLRYRNIWNRILEELRGNVDQIDYVLIDPGLLREVLRNVATNVRYTVKHLDNEPESYQDLVKLKITRSQSKDDLGEEGELIVLELDCKGNTFDAEKYQDRLPGSTWEQHQYRVAQFGGMLSLDSLMKSPGTRLRLQLIARNNQAAVLERTF
jgi:signal transduction histidine kinase/hypoxanthine-guanine phosphoribosyltransferase